MSNDQDNAKTLVKESLNWKFIFVATIEIVWITIYENISKRKHQCCFCCHSSFVLLICSYFRQSDTWSVSNPWVSWVLIALISMLKISMKTMETLYFRKIWFDANELSTFLLLMFSYFRQSQIWLRKWTFNLSSA